MRRFLMWMMICLLPLRLWAGDAMAVQHVPPAASAVTVATSPYAAHPCHGVDVASAETHEPAAHHSKVHGGAHDSTLDSTFAFEPGNPHNSSCGDCSVCHGPLAGLSVPAWTAPQQAGALPQALGWNALSASPLPQLKPPRA